MGEGTTESDSTESEVLDEQNVLDVEPPDEELKSIPEHMYKLHASYREKVTHEDSLINQRKTWLLLSQTFLFGAFALVLAELHSSDNANLLSAVIITVGAVSSLAILLGIAAADSAIRKTRSRWEKVADKVHRERFPALTGSGSGSLSGGLGALSGYATPFVLLLAWGAMAWHIQPFDLFEDQDNDTEVQTPSINDQEVTSEEVDDVDKENKISADQ